MPDSIPSYINGARVVSCTPIDARHRFTGNTRQIVAGEVQGQMSNLAICQYPDDSSFYLFGCDNQWQVITDTYHLTLLDAKEQAEFEYEGVKNTWIDADWQSSSNK